ncbi:MAG: DUF1552 domain-containing protein [Fimbriiglobus sp.]
MAGRALSRRTFLRAAGLSLALPALDAMSPAFARTVAAVPRRMFAIQTNMGLLSQNFFPKTGGLDYASTPYLDILRAHRAHMTVLSGVSHPDVDGAHQAESSFLSAAPHPGSAGHRTTQSLDQYAAELLGPVTRFSSFTLDVNAESVQGMVFSRSGVKVPSEKSPAAMYRKMFLQGKPEEMEARIEELRQGRSSLDFVSEQAKKLEKSVSPADRARLDQYFTAVRDYEKQLEIAQEWERKPKPKTIAAALQDEQNPKKFTSRLQLMLDVARLAFASDSTRIVTLFINAFSIVPELPGVKDETHGITHHGGRPEALTQLTTIESAQLRLLAKFAQDLRQTPEDGSNLLDRSMILYGAPMGNANSHANTNLPILLLGGGFRHAGHLAFDPNKNYPLPNLFVSMLQQMNLPTDKFASSTGTMRGLELKG